jgi:hypothetical protein
MLNESLIFHSSSVPPDNFHHSFLHRQRFIEIVRAVISRRKSRVLEGALPKMHGAAPSQSRGFSRERCGGGLDFLFRRHTRLQPRWEPVRHECGGVEES